MFDWKRIQDDKERRRSAAASRSFADKIVTLERLRDRQQQFKQLGQKTRLEPAAASSVRVAGISTQGAVSHGTIKLFVMGADPNLLAAVTSSNSSSVTISVWGEYFGPITGTCMLAVFLK